MHVSGQSDIDVVRKFLPHIWAGDVPKCNNFQVNKCCHVGPPMLYTCLRPLKLRSIFPESAGSSLKRMSKNMSITYHRNLHPHISRYAYLHICASPHLRYQNHPGFRYWQRKTADDGLTRIQYTTKDSTMKHRFPPHPCPAPKSLFSPSALCSEASFTLKIRLLRTLCQPQRKDSLLQWLKDEPPAHPRLGHPSCSGKGNM